MPSVYHCSPYNSTSFTTCCSVAILPFQRYCPQCEEEIDGFIPDSEHWTDVTRFRIAYNKSRKGIYE